MIIDPSKIPTPVNSDQARLEQAFKLASVNTGSVIDLRSKNWSYQNTLHASGAFTILGNSFHRGFQGPGITIIDPKPVIVRDLWMYGGGLTSKATDSANFRGENVRVENADCGFDFVAPDGTDISRVFLSYCEASSCKTGFRMNGSNALDPHLLYFTATQCEVGIDLRQGGSGYLLDHCGGSQTGTLVWANCGYFGSVRDFTCELCELPIRIENDDYNTVNHVSISCLDIRGTTGPYLMKIGCNAQIDSNKNAGVIWSRGGKVEVKGSATLESVEYN